MKTLILIDLQNDFMPGGSLEVENGDRIIPVINKILPQFDLVVATQDWHPENHKSFASNHNGKKAFDNIKLQGKSQTLWPNHCVQNTEGAMFHSKLNTKAIETIFRKGTNPEIDSYSGFYDNNHQKSTGLAGYLKEKNAGTLYFCGLAADICVYYSMIDAVKENFKVYLLQDATQALDDETFNNQIGNYKNYGITMMHSNEL